MSKAQWPFKATDVQRAVAAVRKATGLHVASVTVGPNGITVATAAEAASEPSPLETRKAKKRHARAPEGDQQ